ncbi:hypothetical protein BsWGS_21306 [Bradybaena similaris]
MKGTKIVNTAMNASGLKIPHWLLSAFASLKQQVVNNGFQEVAVLDLVNKQQDSTLKPAEDALPVLLHKEDEETGMMIAPPSLSNKDPVNPFFRTKRSVCTIPANLPQMVRDLNSRLTPSQLIGLNPGESTPPTVAPTDQPNTCPAKETGDWWPRTEVNLRSTCPWRLQQVDLGTDAFPRYVYDAKCICLNGCIGTSPTMRCKEVTYDVTYFQRTGCQDGLALMESRKRTVNIGCHCVGASPQVTVPNENSE